MRSAAAYWRGSERNPQLQRIYGTAWPTRDQLEEHLRLLEEAAKRDHRRIGEELDLFAFSKEIGRGLPLWLPNGTIIRDELEQWARQTERRLGYQRVVTPHITQEDLYYLSGHLPYYAEDMYAPIDIKDQFLEVMRMHDEYYRALGITDFSMVLALRDPANKDKYHDDEMWSTAERITREAMEESSIPYVEELGGAAHYAPKVDFIIRSVTGKEFAASTNQVDLYTPLRFGLTYHDSDGTEKPVVVIHRAPLGSHERFVAYLTEHFAGAFPVWLAPEQIRVIPIVDELAGYANEVVEVLLDAGLRADVDASDGRLNAKIRAAVTRKVTRKIPLIVVVGRREAEQRTVIVRDRAGKETLLSLDEFVGHAKELVRSKSLEGAGHLRRETGTGTTQGT